MAVRRTFDFKPPKDSSLVSWSVERLVPTALWMRKIARVELSPADRRRLCGLDGQRVVLAPNHPSCDEPSVVWALSANLHRHFNYMVSRHLFDLLGGRLGWLLQRGGSYSVLRAAADRDAIRTTRELLVAGKRWLVVFPEGETGGHNDLVLPFHSGVVQMGFWAATDLVRARIEAPLYVLPLAIKYVYLRDMRGAVYLALRNLEEALGLPVGPEALSPYERLRRVGERVLTCLERSYNVRFSKDADMDARIDALRERILSMVSHALGVAAPEDETLPDRIRVVFNALDQAMHEPVTSGFLYEQRLHAERHEAAMALFGDMLRVRKFMAISDHYVGKLASVERFLEVVSLLESEVLGRASVHGWRKAVVRVGEPIDLSALRSEYRREKRAAVAEVTEQLQGQTESMLERMAELTPAAPWLLG